MTYTDPDHRNMACSCVKQTPKPLTWAQEADALMLETPSLEAAARELARGIDLISAPHVHLPLTATGHVAWASAHIRAIRRTLPKSKRIGRRWINTDIEDPTWHLWAALEHLANAASCRVSDPLRDALAACGLRDAEAHLREWWNQTQKETPMRTFTLVRDTDHTGISGTGTVAEGVEFSDGVVALRWVSSSTPTSVVFHDHGIASVQAIHGHGGATRIVWKEPTNPCCGQFVEGEQTQKETP